MANALYDSGRELFLEGSLDWDANTIKVILIDTADYSKNLATHDYLDDVAAGARVATSSALGSKTTTAGVADAADVTLSAVSGDVSEEIVGYADSGVEGTSALIFNMDTASGLPVTPNGGNIGITWNASGIFKL